MNPLCINALSNILRLVLLWLIVPIMPGLAVASPSVAFYYADKPPVDILAQYDWVVLETDHVSDAEHKALRRFGAELFAYVSLGEAERFRDSHQDFDPAMFRGENTGWNSDIVDVAHPDWQHYLLEQRIPALWQQGYRAFFLDTLDSYQAGHEQKDWPAQQQALVDIIEGIKRRYPEARLILNRGFEFIDRVADKVEAVAVESLYAGWDPQNKAYRQVPQKDRDWLLPRLERVKELGLEVIVIDYLPPGKKRQAQQTAKRIRKLGYLPWVSTPQLDYIGAGNITPIPRRVLMLYDSKLEPEGQYHYSDLHLYVEVPLEYLGYVPVMHDIQQGLPRGWLHDRYAGVVTWFPGKTRVKGYGAWLRRYIEVGGRLANFGAAVISEDTSLLELFDLQRSDETVTPLKLGGDAGMMNFEIKARLPRQRQEYFRLRDDSGVRVHMYVEDDKGHRHPVVMSGSWGGVILYSWSIDYRFDDLTRWIVNPFAFLQQALQLPAIPMPDMTTENGSRLWLNHIDGDGFLNRAEMPGNQYAGKVVLERILKKYHYPHTVSIVEGEIGATGLYPAKSAELEGIARQIFALPNVEAASHSYSHPFEWQALREGESEHKGYNLPIEGYRFNLHREITGSIDYINRRLLPRGRKARVFLWSGDALPGEKALQIVDEAGLHAMNGGDTKISDLAPFLSLVSPATRTVGNRLQIYAPIMNENVYTNNWHGPYYGFRRVIETFRRTDRPRRLKPIDIYYHFYSGSKPAALKALEQAYHWAGRQQTLPLYVSDYVTIVKAWRQVAVARLPDGGLRYLGTNRLRTLRLPDNSSWPDMMRSRGVAGVRQLHDGRYLHLSGDDRTTLYLVEKAPTTARLYRSNGRILDWRESNVAIEFRLRAEVPLVIIMAAEGQQCRLESPARIVSRSHDGNRWRYRFAGGDSGQARFVCKAQSG